MSKNRRPYSNAEGKMAREHTPQRRAEKERDSSLMIPKQFYLSLWMENGNSTANSSGNCCTFLLFWDSQCTPWYNDVEHNSLTHCCSLHFHAVTSPGLAYDKSALCRNFDYTDDVCLVLSGVWVTAHCPGRYIPPPALSTVVQLPGWHIITSM